MKSRKHTRPFLLGVLALAIQGGVLRAQVPVALAAESVRAVQGSEWARRWDDTFVIASAGDVVASLRRKATEFPSDSLQGGENPALRVGISTAVAAGFQLAPRGWRCDSLEDFHQVRCALDQYKFYVTVSPLKVRADTVTVDVVVFKRRSAETAAWEAMGSRVTALPDAGRWRVVKVEELRTHTPPQD